MPTEAARMTEARVLKGFQDSGPEIPVEFETWEREVSFDEKTQKAIDKRFIHYQQVLGGKKVLVVGCGSIGNTYANFLSFSGVGEIVFVDMDDVEAHNLMRSVYFRAEDIGKPKALVLARRTAEASPFSIRCTGIRADVTRLGFGFMEQFDLLMSPVDSWSIRAFVSRGAKLLGKPHITSGTGVIGFGKRIMATTMTVEDAGSEPCYECLCPGDLSEEEKRLSCLDYAPESQPQVMSFSAVSGGLACQSAIRLMSTGFHNGERTPEGRPKGWKYVVFEPGMRPDADGISTVTPRSASDCSCSFHRMMGALESQEVPVVRLSRKSGVRGLHAAVCGAIGESPEYILDIRKSYLLFMAFPDGALRKTTGLLPVSTYSIDDRDDEPEDSSVLSRLPRDHIYLVADATGLQERTRLVRIVLEDRGGEGMATYTAKAEWAPKAMMLRDGTFVSRGTRIFRITSESSEFCVSEEEYWAKWASRVRSTSSTASRSSAARQPVRSEPVARPKPMRIAPIAFSAARRQFTISLMERRSKTGSSVLGRPGFFSS